MQRNFHRKVITAISWVPKGVSKSASVVADASSMEEIEEIIKCGAIEEESDGDHQRDGDMDVDDVIEATEVSHASAAAEVLGNASSDMDDAMRELDMDHYDDEDHGIELFNENSYYPSNKMDPYLKDDDIDSEEEEDLMIRADDGVIVCARDAGSSSQLVIYILEDTQDGAQNLYVHHHIDISASPLCIAWLDCPVKGEERGNLIALGSMKPAIEIWDLDVVDELQPCLVLGGGKERKGKKSHDDGHIDSVLGLAWNKEFRNILASASADKVVKVWDVASGKCNITMDHHTREVQAVAWNPHAPQVLLSGSFDCSVVMRDGRKPSHSGYKWSIPAEVESLAWDPHCEHAFIVSLENGMVQGFDVRAASSCPGSESKPSFTLHAHDKAVCSISFSPVVPNLLATGSSDEMIKLWDLSNNKPSCIASRNPKAGEIFSISFSENSPFVLAIGGLAGALQVWDALSDAAVAQRYARFNSKSKSGV